MSDLVAFFDLLKTADGRGYIGALLVTDELGKPEEFRVTYPVKPTAVQRHLYGASLEPHIGVVLCAAPLIGDLRTREDVRLVLLNNDQYTNLSTRITCDVMKVERLGEQITVSDTDHGSTIDLRPGRQSFQPVRLVVPAGYDPSRVSKARARAGVLVESLDLLEPFERISKAVAALAEADGKFQ